MARSDLVLHLVQHGLEGNPDAFRRTVETLVADERSKNHHTLADRIAGHL